MGRRVKESVQRAADSAASAGSRVWSELATESAENLKGRASDFVDTAKGMASDASNRLQQTVNEQKGAGAEYVSRLAHSLDRAADQVEGEFPIAGSYMRTAASQVQTAAEVVKDRQFGRSRQKHTGVREASAHLVPGRGLSSRIWGCSVPEEFVVGRGF